MNRDVYTQIDDKLNQLLQQYFSLEEIDKFIQNSECINISEVIKNKYKLLLKMYRKIEFVTYPREIHTPSKMNIINEDEKSSVNLLIKYLKCGDRNIISYISKTINDLSFNDNLLNHDKIYHFHLREKRSGKRLFVYITNTDCYLIDCYPHKVESNEILTVYRKLYNDFPHLFEVKTEYSQLTNEQIKNIRKENGNILDYPLSDNIIGHLKEIGGVNGNGEAMLDIINTDIFMDSLESLDKVKNTLSEQGFLKRFQHITSNL